MGCCAATLTGSPCVVGTPTGCLGLFKFWLKLNKICARLYESWSYKIRCCSKKVQFLKKVEFIADEGMCWLDGDAYGAALLHGTPTGCLGKLFDSDRQFVIDGKPHG